MIGPDSIRLDGRLALVTGGAGGIGKGIALGLAAFGADVAIIDINVEEAAQTIAEIKATGRRALFIEQNLLEIDEIEGAVAQASDALGTIDILVNNVGGTRAKPFVEMKAQSRARQIDLNLNTMFAATQAVVSRMIAAGKPGSIINIASIEGLRAAPYFAVYSAAKAGMINFSRTVALELGEHGITVNVIAPDMVRTKGLDGFLSSDPQVRREEQRLRAEQERRYIPLSRAGTLDDCAGAAVFLCSEMGRYLTGNVLSVDGGTHASSGWTRDRKGKWVLMPQDVD
jgi:NAD(P)-dependent dehydrogenase (short-subunit alcohol dehydrogenase family)